VCDAHQIRAVAHISMQHSKKKRLALLALADPPQIESRSEGNRRCQEDNASVEWPKVKLAEADGKVSFDHSERRCEVQYRKHC
jgi:hypothetical protein